MVIVVGFLGAGKTTFLREILPLLESRGLKPFVIINDYANARVDASSLRKEGRSVTPINGNCICCDSVMELLQTLLEIPEDEGGVVLVEANGTSDPTALIEHLLVNPVLRERFAPLVQVSVVDVSRWQRRHWHNELERLQVETASHILFTREDAVSRERLEEVRGDIEWFNPRAEWIKRQKFALLLEELVKGEKASLRTVEGVEGGAASEHGGQAGAEGSHKHGGGFHHHDVHEHGHGGGDSHGHDRHQLSHGFVGMEVGLPEPMAAVSLQRWLQELPDEVLRVKGVVRLAEEPDKWFQFHRVDDRRGEAALFELPEKPVVPACAVLIGVRLDEDGIRGSLQRVLAQESSFSR